MKRFHTFLYQAFFSCCILAGIPQAIGSENNESSQQNITSQQLGNQLRKKQSSESNGLRKKHTTEQYELGRKRTMEQYELGRKHTMEQYELGINQQTQRRKADDKQSEIIRSPIDTKSNELSPSGNQQTESSDDNQVASTKAQIEKLQRITPAAPSYRYETSSFTGAVSTVWTDMTAPILGTKMLREKYDEFYSASRNYRSMAEMQLAYANRFLKNNDVVKARQYIDEYHRYIKLFNLSNQGASAAYLGNIDSSREFAKGIYEGSKAAASYGANMVPGPWASSLVDGVFTVTDFAVDGTDIGISGASKKVVSKVIAKTILDYAKIDELGGKSFSQALDEGITGAIGSSKLYSILDKSLQSPEFQKQLMSVLARSASYGGRKLTEDQASKLIYAVVNSGANQKMLGK